MGLGCGISTFCTVGNNDGVTGENIIVKRDLNVINSSVSVVKLIISFLIFCPKQKLTKT